MGRRVLDWNGLVRVAERRNPPDRLIWLHELPARVVPHLAVNAGFYVRTSYEGAGDDYWSLRTAAEIVLLRQLVEAGAVTIDDPDLPASCFVTGCTAALAENAHTVHTNDGRVHQACFGHWSGIFMLLGRQD